MIAFGGVLCLTLTLAKTDFGPFQIDGAGLSSPQQRGEQGK
jgi:hypothetical protein